VKRDHLMGAAVAFVLFILADWYIRRWLDHHYGA